MARTAGSETSKLGFDGKPRKRIVIGKTPETTRTSVTVRNGEISQTISLVGVDPAKVHALLAATLEKGAANLK